MRDTGLEVGIREVRPMLHYGMIVICLMLVAGGVAEGDWTLLLFLLPAALIALLEYKEWRAER